MANKECAQVLMTNKEHSYLTEKSLDMEIQENKGPRESFVSQVDIKTYI